MTSICWPLILGIGWAATIGGHAAGETALVDFAHEVVPILKRHCVACHGGSESKGGFSLNTRELILDADVIRLGQPAESPLMELVLSSDPDHQMPPRDRPRVTDAEVAVLQRWIAQQLPWEPGFRFAAASYEPPLLPHRPTVPAAQDGRENPVDRIVDAYLAEHAVTRPQPLDDRQFLRRVYLDVLGILPPADRVEPFVADAAPDKRNKLVDDLLSQSEAYATHWLSFWNDLLRNSYSGTGYIDGGRKQMTEWLFRALYTNMPYDEFVRQIVSPAPGAEGFIRGIKWRGNVNASQVREVQFAQNVSQVFLGINMKCSSCHDSFIDRWTLEETYGMAAIYAEQPLEIHRCDKAQGRMAKAAWIFPELGQIDAEAPPAARLRQLAALMTHPQNGRLTRTYVNRLWHRLMGKGIVHPVDAMHTPPWNADLLDYLALYLSDQGYDTKQLLRLVLNSAIYQSHAAPTETDPESGDYVFAGPVARRLTAEQFVDAIWQVTGSGPQPDASLFQRDGRDQHGQLRDVLLAMPDQSGPSSELLQATPDVLRQRWGNRALRAAFTGVDPLQAQLGRPIREQVVSSRPTQLTTLQAITLANGAELADVLRRGAEKLASELSAASANAPANTQADVPRQLYLALLTRPPTPSETEACGEGGTMWTAPQIEDLLWTLLMLPEFQIVR